MGRGEEKTNPTRLAVVNFELCKPSQCASECRKACPVNKTGKECIKIEKKSIIMENLCIGCSACQKKCPFKAISIINLPTNLNKEITHRYGMNGFKLHRLPIPRPGKVLGLVGTNGIGKSTALKILSGEIKPNLGKYDDPPGWEDILGYFRGSELQGYFTKILEGHLKITSKIQYIDRLPKLLKKKFNAKLKSSLESLSLDESRETLSDKLLVKDVLEEMDRRGKKSYYIEKMYLGNILDRDVEELSGGELQRFSLALACMQESDVYIFDEPSSYLDVKQRLSAAKEIRDLCEDNSYVIVVEHDLAILDLMSDFGCVLYGQSGAYGVITAPYAIKSAINIFLDGYIPTENMRFRPSELKFDISERPTKDMEKRAQYWYGGMTKTHGSFKLEVKEGSFSDSEIIVFLGENGMGKTTLVGLIAGLIKPDGEEEFTKLSYSLKPQKILPKYKGTVRELFMSKIRSSFLDQSFVNEVIKPLGIEYTYDQRVQNLSGGELQRIAIAICLGKDANIYLIDEPSAFLDSDQRIAISKIIKKFIYSNGKIAFIVEHDLIVGTYLADKVIVFEGEPGVSSVASAPMDLLTGMNIFLKNLDVTFRRDPSNLRPRINKPGSAKDRMQKENNQYFFS
ncbi:ATPase/RNase L inhibitor [Encephalitozoon intestinalis ATCC 50506]|uniref:ATPase/RNase L inhibitor n=1 Tax=Encephalitozoon intestinalis (strain ATCC 50506) TaxID=876142 RepID=E0SA24_ENCIT|nr:ATPase/RNase L inhibitor [Encephalitozoon intestinalis ATCC 50506]ADM12646.1 ATPase/RNase L inhibitor [Encephalitozoon intestinalis ATCC 50506]UTX46506.1 translation initiation factor RLI1 [Encephalitozoon intestinalis]